MLLKGCEVQATGKGGELQWLKQTLKPPITIRGQAFQCTAGYSSVPLMPTTPALPSHGR